MPKRYTHKPEQGSPLKAVLLTAVPTNREGNKTISHLATLLPCRRTALQLWLDKQKIPPRRVNRLLEIAAIPDPKSPGPVPRITREQLLPFVDLG